MAKVDRIYKLESKEDFQEYLKLIIEHSYKCLDRYKMYHREIEDECLNILKTNGINIEKISVQILRDLLENLDGEQGSKLMGIKVEFKKYTDLRSKIIPDSSKLVNLLGDRTKEAVSYLKFRDELKKFDSTILNELNEDLQATLNKLYQSRNLMHHVTDSQLISQQEYRKKQKEIFGGLIYKPEDGIITINKYNYVEIGWILELYITSCSSIQMFKEVIQQMKKDYSVLIGKSMRIERAFLDVLPFNYAQISHNAIKHNIEGPKKFDIEGNIKNVVVPLRQV